MRLGKKSIPACFLPFQLSIRSGACLPFGGGAARRGLLQGNSPGSSSFTTERQFARPSGSTTSLFGGEDDDGGRGDSDEKPQQPVSDLDIFGQPKGKSKRNAFDDEGDIRGPDRIKSCIPYVLPLIDGDDFGRYIYERVPPLGTLDYVLLRPLADAVRAAPLLSILLFVVFAVGPRFASLSREVRFNAQQAVLIDVALILPSLIGDAVAEADANLPRAVMEPCSNFVWYAYVSLVVYCVISNLRGSKPDQIPFISNAAEYATGPF